MYNLKKNDNHLCIHHSVYWSHHQGRVQDPSLHLSTKINKLRTKIPALEELWSPLEKLQQPSGIKKT